MSLDAATIQRALTHGNGNVTMGEIKLFVELCKAKRMNPFEQDCYIIKYGDKNPATIVTGKGYFLKRAESNPRCKGFRAGVYVITAQGNYKEREGSMLLPGETLLGGWAEVFKEGWEHPVKETVALNEYNTGKSGWAKMPATMIRKVALCHALREAFPNDYSGLYSEEEVAQASQVETVDVEYGDPEPCMYEEPCDEPEHGAEPYETEQAAGDDGEYADYDEEF